MPEAPPRMRWWGWGEDAHAGALPAHARPFLEEHVGIAAAPRPPVALEQVQIEASALPESARAELAALLGSENVRGDHADRVLHAAGKGYPDLVRLRAGTPEGAPDAVLYPESHEQLRALLELCSARSLAVVPFGGGTSVVGGLAPLRGAHQAVLALDLARLSGISSFDAGSATVTVGAGTRGPALERELDGKGLDARALPAVL